MLTLIILSLLHCFGKRGVTTVAVLAPQDKKIKQHVTPHLGCHVSVDRVKIGLWGQNCHMCKT